MKEYRDIIRDAAVVALSLSAAFYLARAGAVGEAISAAEDLRFLGSFVSGIFFTSIFTVAPATVALAEIAKVEHPAAVALFGGLGALIGDYVIFRFVKDRITADLLQVLRSRGDAFRVFYRARLFCWVVPLIGALIVASPLPDELGLLLLGIARTKTRIFIPLSFLLNFFGILMIGLIARAAG